MGTNCAGIGDSQVKPSCEFSLAAASATPGTTWLENWYVEKEEAGGSLKPVVAV